MMGSTVFGEGETRALIRKKMASGEWWLIAGVSRAGQDLASMVEERFYEGEANVDFEVLLGQFPGVVVGALYFAHKRRMSGADFREFLLAEGGRFPDEPADAEFRDVVCPPDAPPAFLEWLLHDVGKGLGPRF